MATTRETREKEDSVNSGVWRHGRSKWNNKTFAADDGKKVGSMQGYQRNFEDQQRDQREEETIVVDLVPPQYQLSPPHSPPPGNMPKTPEKGEFSPCFSRDSFCQSSSRCLPRIYFRYSFTYIIENPVEVCDRRVVKAFGSASNLGFKSDY